MIENVTTEPVIAGDLLSLAQDILDAQFELSSGQARLGQNQAYAMNSFNLRQRQLNTAFERSYPQVAASVAASGFGNSGQAARAISRAFEDRQLSADSLGLDYQNHVAGFGLQQQALEQYALQLQLLQEQQAVYAGLYG